MGHLLSWAQSDSGFDDLGIPIRKEIDWSSVMRTLAGKEIIQRQARTNLLTICMDLETANLNANVYLYRSTKLLFFVWEVCLS